MRDIREELQERLSEARAKRQKYIALAKDAEVEEASIRRMLEIEDRRFSSAEQQAEAPWEPHFRPVRKRLSDSPLVGFLTSTLDDGKPHSLSELAVTAATRGFRVEEGKSMKRTLNATLLSLMHKKRVKHDDDGKWVWIMKREASPAETDEASP